MVVENDDSSDPKHDGSSSRAPLRKVYRRGFVARDEQGRPEERGEITVEGEGEERVEAGEEIAERIEDEGEPVEDAVEHTEETNEDLEVEVVPDQEIQRGVIGVGDHDVVVTQATTPPAYARPEFRLDDDNPWA